MDTRYDGRGVELFPTPEMRNHSVTAASGQEEVEPINQLDTCALEQDALEVLRLIRSRMNGLAPINKIPPDVLTLIPDFCSGPGKEKLIITLTHVCRDWREMFISRASLWANLSYVDAEKTRVYLKRSKSSPINLCLKRAEGLVCDDPFQEITPPIVGRLKCLFLQAMDLRDITKYLTHPAPLLEHLTINRTPGDPRSYLVLPTTLFDGDLSSLRELHLYTVRTQLPWRSMINLTCFSLGFLFDHTISIGQLLDFFESAPRLLEVELLHATPFFGAQNGRVVSLGDLKKLTISGGKSSSLLLDHLLIPVGVEMTTSLDLPGPQVEDHLPGSLKNLKNLSNFTKISFYRGRHFVSLELIGPNGRASMVSTSSEPDDPHLAFQSLTQLDTSKTQWLKVVNGDLISGGIYQALSSMTDLRTLTISRCKSTISILPALNPAIGHKDSMMCPKLEEIVFRTSERFNIESMVDIAAARALRGSPLRSVRIIGRGEPVPREGVIELLKHVANVETSLDTGNETDYSSEDSDGDDDDEDWGEGVPVMALIP